MKKTAAAMLAGVVLTQPIFASASQTAKVLMARGEVTKLLPGAHSASQVKAGDVLPEDTSVLTGDRSIVRLRFADNSTMNLGPKSKVVIAKMPERQANMVSLLTGSIKAEVDKADESDNRNKMIVKTRSAVMGVRGTKFTSTFNPVNKNTGLVTVEGRVAMLKKESAPKDGVAVASAEEELAVVDQKLKESEEVVEVEAGRYSGVGAQTDAPTAPVKIAPVQFEAIAKTMGSDTKAEDVMRSEDAKAELASLEGAPRPGGFLDFETGIYVPPPKDAELDEATGTFKSDQLGKVDESTGDYIPPQGVKLDPKKGFVVDQEEVARLASAGVNQAELRRTLAAVTQVNTEIKQQIAVNKLEAEQFSARPWYAPKSHLLSVEVAPYSEVLELDDIDSKSRFYSKSAFDALLVWSQAWSDRWSSRIKLGGTKYEFEDESKFYDKKNDEQMIVSVGGSFKATSRLTLDLDLVSRPMYFVAPLDQLDMPEGQVLSAKMEYISLGAKYFLFDWKKLGLSASGRAMIFGRDKVSTYHRNESLESFGVNAALNASYAYSKTLNLDAALFGQTINHEVVSIEQDVEFDRSTLGLSLQMSWNL